MKRTITRVRKNRYCTVQITLEGGRLSVTGEEGRIEQPKAAKAQALAYWRTFFEEDPHQICDMNQRCGTKFTSPRSAAKYVVDTDGEYHGLDARESGGKVFVGESFGQIVSVIAEWFPEVAPLLPWHLNDMKAGCEHQDALGWGHGKTIALTADELTQAQREVIEHRAAKACAEKREKEFAKRWAALRADRNAATAWIKSHTGGTCSVDQINHFFAGKLNWTNACTMDLRAFDRWMREDVAKDVLPEKFDARIYKDSLCAPCPTCGYEYGTAWLKRELPAEIVRLAETVGETEENADVAHGA